MLEYESFCVYGFCTVYPVTWKVELNPKSERSEGDVAFKSPERVNIFVSWGPLEKAKKRYSSLEEHAKDSLKRIKKNSGVKEVELIQRKVIRVNSHKAIFSHVKIIIPRPSFLPFKKEKTDEREVRCMHLHCKPSERYFVIFGEITPDKSLEHGEVFKNIMKSFICHKTEGKI